MQFSTFNFKKIFPANEIDLGRGGIKKRFYDSHNVGTNDDDAKFWGLLQLLTLRIPVEGMLYLPNIKELGLLKFFSSPFTQVNQYCNYNDLVYRCRTYNSWVFSLLNISLGNLMSAKKKV